MLWCVVMACGSGAALKDSNAAFVTVVLAGILAILLVVVRLDDDAG